MIHCHNFGDDIHCTENMENKSSAGSTAAEVLQQVLGSGQTPEKVTEIYDKWSDYDKHMEAWSFRAPDLAAQGIISHTAGNKDVYILDVAAGTGAVADRLKKAGLTNIDALDPSQGMLQISKDKNLYKRYLNVFFTDNVECIKTSTYDVLVACGALTEGHLKLNTFPEMIRCVKPGGLVLLTMPETALINVAEYKDKMEPYIECLQTEGQWQQVEKTFSQEFNSESGGYLFVFKITKIT